MQIKFPLYVHLYVGIWNVGVFSRVHVLESWSVLWTDGLLGF